MRTFLTAFVPIRVWQFVILNLIWLLAIGAVTTFRGPDTTLHPSGWRLDSTTYYRNLYTQGRLNYQLWSWAKVNESKVNELYAKRDRQYRRIDSLSGSRLQREIERQFERRGLNTPSDSLNGGRSQKRSQNQGSLRNEYPGNRPQRQPYIASVAVYFLPKQSDRDDERAESGAIKPGAAAHKRVGRDPFQTQTRQPRTMALANRDSCLPRTQNRRSLRHLRCRYFIDLIYGRTDLVYPRIAVAISALETGWWPTEAESWLMDYHNLFAFRLNSRKFSVVSLRGGYLVYRDFGLSLADYAAFERQVIRKYKVQSERDYFRLICTRYSHDRQYRVKLAKTITLIERFRKLDAKSA